MPYDKRTKIKKIVRKTNTVKFNSSGSQFVIGGKFEFPTQHLICHAVKVALGTLQGEGRATSVKMMSENAISMLLSKAAPASHTRAPPAAERGDSSGARLQSSRQKGGAELLQRRAS